MTPSVRFTQAPVDLEVAMFYGFLFDNDWGWGKYILRKHPDLKRVLLLKTEKERTAAVRTYITQYRKTHRAFIQRRLSIYRKMWKKRERAILRELSRIIETDWPKKRKTITADLSINPICPRFLKTWSFSLSVFPKKPSEAMMIIMHEICHFLYFKKWKEVFPNANPRTFESPHPVWHLSELVAPIVLNDPGIEGILKPGEKLRAGFYDEHKAIRIKKISAPAYFTRLYRRRSSFESFLREAEREMKKYRKKFEV
jgi:hypothetical protein